MATTTTRVAGDDVRLQPLDPRAVGEGLGELSGADLAARQQPQGADARRGARGGDSADVSPVEAHATAGAGRWCRMWTREPATPPRNTAARLAVILRPLSLLGCRSRHDKHEETFI